MGNVTAMLAIYPAQYQVNSCTGRWPGFVRIAQCGGLVTT